MRFCTAILCLSCFALLSGCSSMNPLPLGAEQHQKEALARWHQCLDRHTGLPDTTQMRQAAHELQSRCEGHRRDVLMSFPATVEPQLDAILREQTLRSAFGETLKGPLGHSNGPISLPSAAAIQTAR